MRYWHHFNLAEPPETTATAALGNAKAQAFGSLSRKDQIRQFRALLLLSLQAATMTDKPGPLGLLSGSLYGGDATRNAAAAAVARTAIVLAPTTVFVADRDLTTWDDEGPIDTPNEPPPIDVSGWPVLAVVGLASLAAVAACYCATVISEAQHAIAFEEQKTARLVASLGASVDVIGQHVQREKIAGKILPFDELETSTVRGLEALQREVVKEKHQPLPTPFDGARDFGEAIAGATKKIGDSAANTLSWGLPVAAAVGLWALSQQGRSS